MAMQGTPLVPFGEPGGGADVAVQRPWRIRSLLSRTADEAERFLATPKQDRMPWLTVAFAGGIGGWFALPAMSFWFVALGIAGALAGLGWACLRMTGRPAISTALVAVSVAIALGMSVIWARSEVVGTEPIAAPVFAKLDGTLLEREEQPAEDRVRLVIATREPGTGRAIKVRINVPAMLDDDALKEGAKIRLGARLMPPSPPILPGAYDFARAAWFKGYAATGSLAGDIEVLAEAPSKEGGSLASAQRRLSAHVRSRVDGSAGSIAAAFASGDRGGIPLADEEAMRDAGLTHLLSISGLHVSAVIAAAYFLALKLLALWPWLALRVRLPLCAATVGAAAGIAYTLLTGAEVPTVRSCIGAVLVLGALALGREPLSMRMVAVAAFCVLLFWPEAVIGPSFQMSFAAVLAIIALHNSGPVQQFLRPREEAFAAKYARRVAMLFITGVVIEIALTPIVLFHFHRAGLYGAFANVVGIPLVTFLSMPLIALALLLDLAGLGGPVWWLAGKSLDLLLWIAHFTSAQPGAVKLVPQMGLGTIALFVGGALWLALWRGRVRMWGLLPAAVGAIALTVTPAADILVTRDGADFGIVDGNGQLHVLRGSPLSYSQTNLIELSGSEHPPVPVQTYPDARCSADFCSLVVNRSEREWVLLVALNRQRIDERQLAAACELSDIVIADRWLPRSCQPRWLKVDGRYLSENGGTAIYLDDKRVAGVADGQGSHGWQRSGIEHPKQEGRQLSPAP
ncbi:ComEC family competence protein [Qipengyuania gaetbuli]|uniref:ComEC/Rec2 family competence protein n=1 Tax=Qipengyuania gaetbuli TaxID=266952 RepID=UPI001C99ABC1|nr:ComEC/Rec2 family competence protein [Qipengyuania gaetbuli]MBY6013774.1 ComEC family competence protein [Qipengyuania gaetbuli]